MKSSSPTDKQLKAVKKVIKAHSNPVRIARNGFLLKVSSWYVPPVNVYQVENLDGSINTIFSIK
jgi:hypothetical protein